MFERPKPARGKTLLYVVLLVAALTCMVMLRECSIFRSYRVSDRPASGDTLDVAIEYSPMSLYRYADTLGGFNYDVIRQIAAQKGVPLKFHPLTNISQGLEGLDSHKYDILVADVARTTDMQDRVIFTEPSFLDKQVLVQLRDSATHKGRVTSQIDLGGDTIWVPKGSPAVSRLYNLSREIGREIPVKESDEYGSEQLFMLTSLGQIPMAVVNEATALRLAKDYPQVDVSLGISFTQFQSWLIARDRRQLADSVNAALKEFKDSESYARLAKRYRLHR